VEDNAIVESSWATEWTGYASSREALQAGAMRLSDLMQSSHGAKLHARFTPGRGRHECSSLLHDRSRAILLSIPSYIGMLFTCPRGVSIRTKLWIGFVAMVLLAGVIATVATVHLSRLAWLSRHLIEEEIHEVHLLRESAQHLLTMERTLELRILDERQQEVPAISDTEHSIRELMTAYERLHPILQPDMHQGLREFALHYRAVEDTTADILRLVQREARAEARALLLGAWKVSQRGVLHSLNLLMGLEDREARQVAESIQAESRSTRTSIIELAVGGIILGCALAFWIISSVTRPVSNLIEVTNRIAGGAMNSQAKILREDEIGTLTRRFNEMVRRLSESFQNQRRFYGDVSHELRIPLTIIRGEAEVALRGAATSVADYRDALQIIVDVVGQAGRLIDDLLFLSRSEEGQIQYKSEPVPLAPLIDGIVHHSQGFASLKDVDLRLAANSDLITWGDPQRLRQLLFILLDNAIKYTPAGGTVSLALTSDPSWIKVVISDTGVGISKEDLPIVFERFYRVDAARASAAEGGAGLGLSIARSIINAHKGDLLMESVLGRGTTVSVLLPHASNQRWTAPCVS